MQQRNQQLDLIAILLLSFDNDDAFSFIHKKQIIIKSNMIKVKNRYADIHVGSKDNNSRGDELLGRTRMNRGELIIRTRKEREIPKELSRLQVNSNNHLQPAAATGVVGAGAPSRQTKEKLSKIDTAHGSSFTSSHITSSDTSRNNENKYSLSMDHLHHHQNNLLSPNNMGGAYIGLGSSTASSSSAAGGGGLNNNMNNSNTLGNSSSSSSSKSNRRMYGDDDDDYGFGVALEVGMAAIDTDAETQFALLAINNSEINGRLGSSTNGLSHGRNQSNTPTQSMFGFASQSYLSTLSSMSSSSASGAAASSSTSSDSHGMQANMQLLQQRIMKLEFELETLRMENEGLTEDKKVLMTLVRSLKNIESEAEKYRMECVNLRAMNNELHEIIKNIRS